MIPIIAIETKSSTSVKPVRLRVTIVPSRLEANGNTLVSARACPIFATNRKTLYTSQCPETSNSRQSRPGLADFKKAQGLNGGIRQTCLDHKSRNSNTDFRRKQRPKLPQSDLRAQLTQKRKVSTKSSISRYSWASNSSATAAIAAQHRSDDMRI